MAKIRIAELEDELLDKNRIVLYHRFFDIFPKGGNKA
jgi:hypothetical protein